MEDKDLIFIPYNTPSSKNGRPVYNGVMVNSVLYKRWIRDTASYFLAYKVKFLNQVRHLPKPYYIEITFHRKSKHIFDYHNIVQSVADAMKDNGWIADDNADEVKFYFGDYVYNKEKPGVYIKVLKEKPKHY